MCSNEKGAGRQVVHWWGGRLIGGTRMQAFTATQRDIRPDRSLRRTPVQANAHVCTGTFDLLLLLASPLCPKREQEPLCSALLLNTVCITHRRARWRFSFVLYYLWYQFLHLEHQPSGYKIDFFLCAIQRKMCQIKYKRHLREQG